MNELIKTDKGYILDVKGSQTCNISKRLLEGHLEIVNGENLKRFSCSNNQLTYLDLSGCKYLIYLFAYNHQLTYLNVIGRKNLKFLSCSDDQINSLYLNGCKSLIYVSACKKLRRLER